MAFVTSVRAAVLQHRPTLLAYIERQLPPRLARTVEAVDILQDVYIVALASDCDWLYGADEQGVIRGLKTIAKNKIIDALRWHDAVKRGAGKVSGPGFVANNSAARLIEEMVRFERTPSASAMSREAHELIKSTLEGLGDDQATALRLRFGSGLSLKEVGDQMSRTQDAARKLCDRALQELRLRLVSTA